MTENRVFSSKAEISRCFCKLRRLAFAASLVAAAFLPWTDFAYAESAGLVLVDKFKVADKSEGFSEPSGLAIYPMYDRLETIRVDTKEEDLQPVSFLVFPYRAFNSFAK